MKTRADHYEYPSSGRGSETVAVLADGRRMTVDTQYGVIIPQGKHDDDCAQVTEIGGTCSCGMIDGVDVDSLVYDARERGLRGKPQTRQATPTTTPIETKRGADWCHRCESYCYGDCSAAT